MIIIKSTEKNKNSIQRQDIIFEVAKRTEYNKKVVNEILVCTFDYFKELVLTGKGWGWHGFAEFDVISNFKFRKRHNPRTMETVRTYPRHKLNVHLSQLIVKKLKEEGKERVLQEGVNGIRKS